MFSWLISLSCMNIYSRSTRLDLQGLSDQAVDAFRLMRADGLKPSILALNALINAFGEDRRDAEAFSVLQYMKENVSHDVVFCLTVLLFLLVPQSTPF